VFRRATNHISTSICLNPFLTNRVNRSFAFLERVHICLETFFDFFVYSIVDFHESCFSRFPKMSLFLVSLSHGFLFEFFPAIRTTYRTVHVHFMTLEQILILKYFLTTSALQQVGFFGVMALHMFPWKISMEDEMRSGGSLLEVLNRIPAWSRTRTKLFLRDVIDTKYLWLQSVVDTSEAMRFGRLRRV